MSPPDIAYIFAAVIALIILGFAGAVLYLIFCGKIELAGILSEPRAPGDSGPAKASLSRFQFLIFTFVIAGLYLILSLESGNFVDIPDSVLVLLGISGGSYLVSKGLAKNGKNGKNGKTGAPGGKSSGATEEASPEP